MRAYARRYAAAVAAGQLALVFHFEAKRATTNRARVLEVIEAASTLLTGREVAERAGLDYKPALEALTFLHNEGRVAREGRTITARWGRRLPDTGHQGLEAFFRTLARTQNIGLPHSIHAGN